MNEELTRERLQALITRAPYHQWLGLKVVALHDDGSASLWYNDDGRFFGGRDIHAFINPDGSFDDADLFG